MMKAAGHYVICTAAVVLACAAVLCAQPPGFYVDGRFLHSPCGDKVVLRGANAMIFYLDRLGTATYPELAKTGANVCRIFWRIDPTAAASEFDATIQNCIDSNMIPMPGIWDASGIWDNLQMCVDWWTSPQIAAVVQKHQQYLLVNIASGAGDSTVTDEQFRQGYENAIVQMRSAGILTPLVIDAAGWGRGESYILNNAQYLLDADPEHNLIFSWEPWDPVNWGGTQERIKGAIDGSIDANICMIMGEFSQCERGATAADCAATPIDWEYIITYGSQQEIGWLAWVWWCCGDPTDSHSLTADKIYGHWNNPPWGESVAVTHPYSIQNTAVRPRFVVKGLQCPPCAPGDINGDCIVDWEDLALIAEAWLGDSTGATQDIIAYWRFDEGSGTIAHDSVGGNDGVVHGAQWTAGVDASALGFNGNNAYVDCGNSGPMPGFDLTNNFSLFAWVKVKPNQGYILNKGSARATAPGGAYTLYYGFSASRNSVNFELRNSTDTATQTVRITPLNSGEWTHVVATFADGLMSIYRNGVLAESGLLDTPTVNVNTGPFTIGAMSDGFRSAVGVIDDVRVYNRVLTPQEILVIYSQDCSGTDCANLDAAPGVDFDDFAVLGGGWGQ